MPFFHHFQFILNVILDHLCLIRKFSILVIQTRVVYNNLWSTEKAFGWIIYVRPKVTPIARKNINKIGHALNGARLYNL